MRTAIIVIIILFFTLASTVQAKPKSGPQQPLSVEEIVAKMKTQLVLTDQQVIAVKPIIEDFLAQEKQLRLEEKKKLSRVFTGGQLYTWNFLQNEQPREKKKK